MSQEFNIVGNLLLKVDGAEAGLNKLKNSLSKLEIPKGLENSFKKSFSSLDDIFARYKKQLEKGFDTKADVSNITKIGKELDSELTKVSNHLTKLTGEKVDFKIDTAPVKQATKDLEDILEKKRQLVQEKLEFKIESPKEGIDNIKQLLQEFQRVTGDTKAGRAAGNALFQLETGDIEKAISFLREAENNLNRIGDKKKEAFSSTGFTFGGALETIIKELETTDGELATVSDKAKLFQDILAQAQAGQLKDVDALLEKISQGFTKNASSAREAAKAAQDYAQSTVSMKDQVKQLQQSTQYFFSLRNMINLFKRGIREAVDTVKELDKAMTETAVVTKYSVGDMWAKLPEYTANANALGATVQDMYESTTLYYQQGLNTQQAMGIATETMKMARIAGLEAADATDMMTAALRGFNMEINEASAEHINDVYSNLAAKTASNTEELGTAMQRTASIAHSAGMSFEGTAAFLAQAIETTREPAENLGTAMKTIVARFQELKKNPLEITDVDGEEVSYNKVDTALKTIGVDLKDTNGQFRDLDKVFLDISQKWDGLSQTQQRYIATTAAGSRQQSRFIAMMSDYNRTMELMGYANNSAGASTTQFNKTLDSLEAKINKFQNAWKQFLMGIMNDSWTKKVVDAGTSVLNVVNKIIDTLSVGGRLKGVKSILSTLTAFTALKMAGRGANALIGGLGGMVDPKSSMLAGMRQGALGGRQAANAAQAQMIYQPIVNELRAIRQLQGQQLTQENKERIGAYDQYNKFKDSRAFLTGLTKGGKAFSLQDIQQSLFGLDANSQNILMRSNAGTAYTLTKGILGNYAGRDGYNKNIAAGIKNAERFWNTQRKSGANTWEEYFGAISDPKLLKQGIDKTIGNGKYNPAYEFLDRVDKEISIAASQNTSSSEVMDAFKARYKELAEAGVEDIGAQLRKEGWAEKIKTENQKQRQKIIQKDQGNFQNSNAARVLNTIGQVGAGFSQVGMGLQAFGNILTSSANPALQMFGTAINTIGGVVSGIGMGISAISSGFTALAGSSIMTAAETALAGKSLFGLSLTAGTLTGILGILVAAIAGAAFLIKKHRDNIRKDAEEITTKYKDKSSENQSNLANLRQWKSELAVLSKGVDENGYNISLDTADYDHYLEIVDSIAKINPEIVQGYNAQGHAIIDNNNALEKTLALEEQHSKDLLRDYTSSDSLTKLLKARNLERNRVAGGGAAGQPRIETIEYELKPRTSMRREAAKIGKELQKNKEFIDLSKIDINIDELASGSEAEFQKVLNNYDLFKRLVSDSIDRAGDEWKDKSREAIEEGFSSFEEYGSDLDELVQPVYEALSASASQTAGFQEMADNLKVPFQNALKELATNGQFEDGKEIDKAAKNMATKFAGYSETYIDAMEKVNEANKQYALDFNEQEYKANTKDAISELEALKTTLEDTPEGHAIAQWIGNEIHKIEDHLSTGTKSIEEAWDTISDKIAVAESALDGFNKATEKDFYSAADDMQKIYETVMDPDAYHTIGYGDNTFWTGAESLLGQQNIMDKTKDEVLGMMKAIEPFLKEGPEGIQNFANKVDELSPKLEKIAGVEMEDGWFKSIDENINPEAWAQIAEYMGISEELLISMVNKSRQFKQWDFSDMPAVREAYSIDETVIHGKKQSNVTTTDETGKETTIQADTLYITDTELRSRMGSDYYQKDKRENKTEELKKQGIEVLPEHLKELSAHMMKTEMGIADWQTAIKTFGDTGVFDKSEIYDAARTLAESEAKKNGEKFDENTFKDQFNEEWTSWLESYEDPTLEPISTIASDVAAIAGKIVGESSADKKEKDDKSDSSTKDASEDTNYNSSYSKPGTNGVTIPGVGFVPKGSTLNPNPYTPEQEKAYSDNHFFTNLFTNLGNKITESAQKQQEVQEAYKDVQGKSAEELKQSNSEFWSKIDGWLNTSVNDKTGYNTETESASTDQVGENLTTGSESLTEAASQLLGGIEPLSTAGASLNTAASNLTTAAAVIANGAGNNNGSNNNSGTVPGVPQTAQPNQSSVGGAIVIDNTAALNSLDEVYQKATETATKVNEGATFTIKTPGLNKLTNAASAAQKITDNAGSKDISLNASVSGASSESIDTLKESVKKFNALGSHKVTLTTSLKGASVSSIDSIIAAINNFHSKTDHTVNLTTNKITNEKAATGAHNHGSFSAPSFGSAAGGYGQVGPKGKGGLTLTGELGYEIAWIPSKNRSMILGANGPQMVNLPGDAVVWTHEQSKKILKQQSIPAGSLATATSSGGWNFSGWGGGSGGGTSASTSKTVTKAANDAKRSVTTAAVKVGKVSVWWENIARKTESVQRKADQAYTKFEKYIKSMQATLKTTGTKGGGNNYINNMSKVLGYNQAQYNKANAQLKNLDKSNKKTTIKYKQGKKEKTSKVKLGNYIKYDSASGTYVIDQKKINKVAGSKKLGGKARAEAIKEEAEKQINERLSKRNKAEDAINKAKEALDKFGEQLYETFFAWENELTKIWNLTQKIAQAESNISRIKSYEELLEKQIATGITSVDDAFKENALANFELEVQQSIDKIVDRQNLLKEQQDAVSKALSLADERETLNNINTILQSDLNETEKTGYENYAKQLTERINTQAAAQKYLNVTQNADGTLKVEFDTESFENDKLQGLYTGDAAKAIQDYVKELVESSETLNQSYNDLTNDIGGMYDSLSDLQQQWVDYANDLWDISDAESKKEAENMKKLSDSITDSLKNLLDEVKRKLDERRRQEDNAKTEKDISQKQQRLAALRADTSGGHQVEIAQLEKEIADAQQDYQRSLEDQLLDKMQQQADLASEQRERQIELQEKIAEEINNAALVDLWMSDPQKYRDQIYEAFKTSNDYDKKPLILQKDLDNQFESMMSGLTTNQSKQDILNTSIENLTGALNLLKQSIEDMQKGTSQKTIEQLRGLGLTDAQIRKAGFSIQDFIKAGTTDVKDLKAAGFSVVDLLGADYKITDIQEAGYTIGQFKTGTGVAGIEGAKLAKEAGYSDEDIAKAYGTEAAMIGANVSGKVAQKVNGTSASEIQSIINKSKTDNAKQGDLGKVQAGKVDINGSKKGGIIKDSHISAGGGRVGANKGSTLYTADWNEEKKEAGKKWTTITIDKLTTALLKTYPDAREALIYAIQHSKPGTKLNKNMKSLVATAKIAGNKYKLNNGIYGSIGSNGKIYYNTKDGVQIWDAAAGKLTLDKYNKSNYLQKALKNNTISREYAQVLINKKAYTKKQLQDKGVKKFVTGGLANYTGPAWLDGTPSKPELVLNAKDTKNFLALKDVLARAMSGISNTSNTYGDIMYEININVDKIEKDYDVDRVVDKVKKEIIKGAGYRNVTQVRNFR